MLYYSPDLFALIKIRYFCTKVVLSFYLDLYGNGGWPLPDVLPIDPFEECQCFDVVVERADPRVCVAAKLQDGGFGRLRNGHLGRKGQRVFPQHDLLVRVRRRFGAERRVTYTKINQSIHFIE